MRNCAMLEVYMKPMQKHQFLSGIFNVFFVSTGYAKSMGNKKEASMKSKLSQHKPKYNTNFSGTKRGELSEQTYYYYAPRQI